MKATPRRISYQKGPLTKEVELIPPQDLIYMKSVELYPYQDSMIELADYLWDSIDSMLLTESKSKCKIQWSACKAVLQHTLDVEIVIEARKAYAASGGKNKTKFTQSTKKGKKPNHKPTKNKTKWKSKTKRKKSRS